MLPWARWALADEASFYVHLKAALPATSLALGLAVIALSPRRSIRRLSPVVGAVLAVLAVFAYDLMLMGLLRMVRATVVSAWLGAWGPPLGFSALALAVLWRRAARLTADARSRA